MFAVGSLVKKNIETWTPSEFDEWGAGEGVGMIVDPPFDLGDDMVDVVWPNGREFRLTNELVLVDPVVGFYRKTIFPESSFV